jgi:phage baseplate assembly protein W
MAKGVNSQNGERIDGTTELTQRLSFCLRTRLGTMPGHPLFGSDLPNLVDHKINQSLELELMVATSNALANPANGFTNDIKLQKTLVKPTEAGVSLTLIAQLLVSGEPITLSGVRIR